MSSNPQHSSGMTIKDIAAKARVAPSTVSRVLNNSSYVSKATRKKIEEVISQYNYVPNALAKGLSQSSTNIVGVMVPEIDNPFFSGVIRGVAEVADAMNYNIILCNTDESIEKEMHIMRVLTGQRICGLLMSSAALEHQQTAEYVGAFQNLGIPVVMVDRKVIGGKFDGVYIDDEQALYDLTTLLINNGHRHIETLAGNTGLLLGQNRVMGYRRAFRTAQLECDERWIHAGQFSKEFGYKTVKQIPLIFANPQ